MLPPRRIFSFVGALITRSTTRQGLAILPRVLIENDCGEIGHGTECKYVKQTVTIWQRQKAPVAKKCWSCLYSQLLAKFRHRRLCLHGTRVTLLSICVVSPAFSLSPLRPKLRGSSTNPTQGSLSARPYCPLGLISPQERRSLEPEGLTRFKEPLGL